VELSSEQVRSGTRALKCSARPYDGHVASKADIGRSGLSFVGGDETWIELWLYIVGGHPLGSVFLLDLEAPGTCTSAGACPGKGAGDICTSPGRRLYLSGPSGDWLKSDLGKWCLGKDFYQPAGAGKSLPTDRWVRLRLHVRFSALTDGIMQVWQDDDLVIDARGMTLPRADAVCDRLQVGITANGNEEAATTLFLDDVTVWRMAPWWFQERGPLRGLTTLPYDLSQQAIEDTYDFIAGNADLIAFHLDDRVPWPEALAGDDQYHRNVVSEIDTMVENIPPGHRIFVSTTPQSTARAGELASYWSWSDGLPLPTGWESKTLDDPEVIAAFTNWCRYLIRRFHPDFFAYAIECNGGFTGLGDPAYHQFLVLARQVYATLKAEHPSLPVILTVQVGSFVAGGEGFLDLTASLLELSDYVAVSAYPYLLPDPDELLTFGDPAGIPEDLFSRIAGLAPGKRFAVAETGYIAETLDIPELQIHQEGRESWQAAYLRWLFGECQQLGAELVVWFVARDHDLMNETLQKMGVPLAPAHLLWRDTGLLDGQGNPRPALRIWRHEPRPPRRPLHRPQPMP